MRDEKAGQDAQARPAQDKHGHRQIRAGHFPVVNVDLGRVDRAVRAVFAMAIGSLVGTGSPVPS